MHETARVACKRKLEPFTSLTSSSLIDVTIARGEASVAYITADSNVIDYVLTEVVEVIDPKSFEVVGYDKSINIQMIATSEIKVSVLIARKDADKAVQAVHDAFIK